MTDEARRRDALNATAKEGDISGDGSPLYSHIRELAPKDEALPKQSKGFFSQTRISMGTAFPALRTVARFLTLESYRSLPKHDKLPDLDDEFIEAELDDLLETPDPGVARSDWDELNGEDLPPSPYQLYLFDQRIKAYLRQTKEQLADSVSDEI